MYNTYNITEESIKAYIKENKDVIAYEKLELIDGEWRGNLYGITDEIIRATGRYCDRYLSDALVTIDSLKNTLTSESINCHQFIFGIRQLGVDGIGFFQSRINDTPELLLHGYYRKIYAIDITETTDEYTNRPILIVELKDISSVYPSAITEKNVKEKTNND